MIPEIYYQLAARLNEFAYKDRGAVDASRCIGCGLCSTTCPTGCLHLVRREIIVEPAVARDPFVGILQT